MSQTPTVDANTWLKRHGDALYAFALHRLFDPQSAEDLVQETLLAAWRNRQDFRAAAAERTWLIGILKHKCVDEVRRSQRRAESYPADISDDDMEAQVFRANGRWREPPGQWARDPLDQTQSQAFIEAVTTCLEGVPEAQRESFVMRELYDLDATTTSELLGVSINNLYVLLHRARLRLRRCLEHRWFASEKQP